MKHVPTTKEQIADLDRQIEAMTDEELIHVVIAEVNRWRVSWIQEHGSEVGFSGHMQRRLKAIGG